MLIAQTLPEKHSKFTCLQLELLLVINYAGGAALGIKTPARHTALKKLKRLDLIDSIDDDAETTARGRKLVDMLTNTPLPQHSWSDPRESK